MVDAGPDQNVVLPAGASLDGTVSDDGLPSPPAATTTLWTHVSGPGTVIFADASAVDTTATFSTAGSYVLRLTADDGALATSDELTLTVTGSNGETVEEVRVAAGSDDAEERPSTSVNITSSDLDMVFDVAQGVDEIVGMRFVGVNVPQGATILNAFVEFQVDEPTSEQTDLVIEGEASDDAQTFVVSQGNITLRPRTNAAVAWSPVPWTVWNAAGPDTRTTNIGPVIEEIVGRGGWSAGNALVLIVSGSGSRVAHSYDGSVTGAPLLHVEYVAANPTPTPTPSATPTATPTPTPTPGPCNDLADNDGDGLVDYPDDPGCRDALWPLEDPQCDDGVDNDLDGKIDWDGGPGGATPDPQCATQSWRDREKARSCGLGFELALLLPALVWLRRRVRAQR